MELTTIFFWFFAVLTVGSALIVVISRNMVRAAFALLFTLFGVAGLYALLRADFLAVTQLLVYVGGILVLLIFGVMLTSRQISVDIKTGTLQTLPSALIVAGLAGILAAMFITAQWRLLPLPATDEATAPVIGRLLLSTYLLPFEIASVILLVALVGAALIARRDKKA